MLQEKQLRKHCFLIDIMNNIFFLITGVALVVFGLHTIEDPIFYDSQYLHIYDFTGYNDGFGCIVVLVGAIFIYLSLRNKSPKSSSYLICTKCRKVYDSKNIDNNKCPTCYLELENLAGFYERHPELK